MVLGVLAALPSYAVIMLRPRWRVDETLDVLAAHGVAGLTGILFIGFVAQKPAGTASPTARSTATSPSSASRCWPCSPRPRTRSRRRSCCSSWSALVMPLRATEHEEALGMDIVAHGEEAYATGEGAILFALGDKSKSSHEFDEIGKTPREFVNVP